MKILFTICYTFLVGFAFCQQPTISLIPQPANLVAGNGAFVLPAGISVAATDQKDVIKIQQMLGTQLSAASGRPVQYATLGKNNPAHTISLEIVKAGSIEKEGYRLQVTAAGISLQASEPAGIFYGVQTLLQLLPKEIESKETTGTASWSVPFVTIEDQPRFGWRGVMLDVVRHWFTKEQVKDF
ncbi:MAG: beta-N-acetylhexosaminidase, partial [Chitinophagaceae bacterium]